MLGPKGNPQARNLLELIAHLQKTSRVCGALPETRLTLIS
jgi:hypothetical protein